MRFFANSRMVYVQYYRPRLCNKSSKISAFLLQASLTVRIILVRHRLFARTEKESNMRITDITPQKPVADKKERWFAISGEQKRYLREKA